MRPRTALAFAPAVISNFFTIHDEALYRHPPDFSQVGATGGGFTLSKGVYTHARAVPGSSSAVSVVVNGDAAYPAATTRKAVELLLRGAHLTPHVVELVQRVEVPIGAGFGSSSASALSATMAVAAALDIRLSKESVASFAHEADITMRTGLGTVSSTYDQSGAAIILKPGGPGVAELRKVRVPQGLRVLTALPLGKGKPDLLSSKTMRRRINRLGEAALDRVKSDRRLETLLGAGREFAEGLGLMGREVETLVKVSLENGAIGASQNMIGNAIHAVVREEDVDGVSSALRSASKQVKVDAFKVGGRRARVLRGRGAGSTHA